MDDKGRGSEQVERVRRTLANHLHVLVGDRLPSQEEVDAVAHFLEAVDQLRASPQFKEEYRSLTLRSSSAAGQPPTLTAHLPDHHTLTALIVPFRRVWQATERCHYRAIHRILGEYVAGYTHFMGPLMFDADQKVCLGPPGSSGLSLTARDLIDVWINTRYMHTGKSRGVGRFTRQDFARFEKQAGPPSFAFAFVRLVCEAATCFENMRRYGKRLLAAVETHGMRPTFEVDPTEAVEWHTPGITPEDTPAHRIWRLRRRRKYQALASCLRLSEMPDVTLAQIVPLSDSWDTFLVAAGIRLTHTPDLREFVPGDMTGFCGCDDPFDAGAYVAGLKPRRGLLARRLDGELVWSGDALEVLRTQYEGFRQALMRQPFL